MQERKPLQEKPKRFVFPSFQHEEGEIERVGTHFNLYSPVFVEKFLEEARRSKLEPLSEDVWAKLDNTDSYDIAKDDWTAVARNAEEASRNWQDLRQKLENGIDIDAPVIAKLGETLHLVTGNTRLMVSRAAGIRPEVLIVDINNLK